MKYWQQSSIQLKTRKIRLNKEIEILLDIYNYQLNETGIRYLLMLCCSIQTILTKSVIQ